MFHRNSVKNHKIESFTYANDAARTGATGLVESDVGKLCYQTDNGYYYRLLDESPVTWSDPIGASSGLIESFTYADEAARTGAVGLVPGDVGKIAYQTDEEAYYRLTDDSPVTWAPLAPAPSAGGSVFIHAIPANPGTDQFIDFTAIPQTHRHLRVHGVIGTSAGTTDLKMQVNGETGADYGWQQALTAATSVTATSNAGSDTGVKLGTTGTNYRLLKISLLILHYSDALVEKTVTCTATESSTQPPKIYNNAGDWDSSFNQDPITSLRFLIAAGAISYGIGGGLPDSQLTLELFDEI
jgi:hypothetical protein